MRRVAVLSLMIALGSCTAILGDDFEIVGAGSGGGSTGGSTSVGGSGGSGGGAQGSLVWSRVFGGPGETRMLGVTSDANGQIVVVGTFDGLMDFGVTQLTSQGVDGFVFKLAADGQPAWVTAFSGQAGTAIPRSVTTDSAGNIVVIGRYSGEVDLGGGPLIAVGGDDVFVVKLTANGAFSWANSYGDLGDQVGRSAAVDQNNRIVVAGNYVNTITFGATAHPSPAAGSIFVAALDANGMPVWSESFGTQGTTTVLDIGVSATNAVLLTGTHDFAVNFGGDDLVPVGGSTDMFLLKLDALGMHVWSKTFGSMGNDAAYGLDIDGDNVAIAGDIEGSVDFGTGALMHNGSSDTFVAMFDASGMAIWSQAGGDAALQLGGPIAIEKDKSDVALAGLFQGDLDWGAGALSSAGEPTNIFFAQVGEAPFSLQLGSNADQQWFPDLVATPDGGVVIAGSYEGGITFDGVLHASLGLTDLFVAKAQ